MEDQDNLTENEVQPDSPTQRTRGDMSMPQQMISFLKEDLWGVTKRYFMEPISGVQALSKNSSPSAPLHAATLMLLGILLLHIGSYILLGDATEQLDMGDHLFISVMPFLTFMLVMTAISFLIKKATRHGGSFKNELTTGALFVFPFLLLLIAGIMVKDSLQTARNPEDLLTTSKLFMAVFCYAFLMMFNTLKQSLKASGASDLVSWYVSPAGVLLGFYASFKILQFIE